MIQKYIPEADLESIKYCCGNRLKRVALFGSVTKGSINAVDIDLALFIEGDNKEEIHSRLLKLNLSKPISMVNINGKYEMIKDIERKNKYHIVVIDSSNPNKKFININADSMVDIFTR
ncbi:nucleotidyltransferase domain-containing protein [bacterium]|nr:nucleotidyltransferase domain-containing protein [bacterium]